MTTLKMLPKIYLDPLFEANLCDICRNSITHPICSHCLKEEVEAWLTLYPHLREELMPRIKKFLTAIEDNRLSESTRCIKCSNKRAAVCPYCFTERVLYELKKMGSSVYVIKEFFMFFNFDFEHTGYSKEAERLHLL